MAGPTASIPVLYLCPPFFYCIDVPCFSFCIAGFVVWKSQWRQYHLQTLYGLGKNMVFPDWHFTPGDLRSAARPE